MEINLTASRKHESMKELKKIYRVHYVNLIQQNLWHNVGYILFVLKLKSELQRAPYSTLEVNWSNCFKSIDTI